MTTLDRERADFEKWLLAEVPRRLKKTKWKKSRCALVNQSDAFYQDLCISVHRNSSVTTAEFRIKPMALDPILWDILNIPENRDKPLSFRTWGAFTCFGLPVYETQVEQSGDTPDIVADKLAAICSEKATLFRAALSSASFSELVAAHPNHVERGAYAITLVTSLINDGNLELARQTASAYVSGALKSCAHFESAGKSFHQLALDWLDSGKYSTDAIREATGA
jgi:hypothetical protein